MILQRMNPNGLTFVIQGMTNEEKTKVRLRDTEKFIEIKMNIFDVNAHWWRWQVRGALIQEAFPMLNPEEREFMQTGITPAEWNTIFTPSES